MVFFLFIFRPIIYIMLTRNKNYEDETRIYGTRSLLLYGLYGVIVQKTMSSAADVFVVRYCFNYK